MSNISDAERWMLAFAAEHDGLKAALSHWVEIQDKAEVLRKAISTPHHRGSALRILLLASDHLKMAVFPTLIESASVGHSDVALCRTVIKSLPRQWVLANIERHVQVLLNGDEEVYRRIAELYREISERLLKTFVDQMRRHTSVEIREIARDFAPGPYVV